MPQSGRKKAETISGDPKRKSNDEVKDEVAVRKADTPAGKKAQPAEEIVETKVKVDKNSESSNKFSDDQTRSKTDESRKQSTMKTPSNVAVPRKSQPYIPPMSQERPLVLATHLVPSLPLALFELLVEMIEIVLERPVVLLYEPRSERPVAKDIVDIAILPAYEEWEDGKLMPVSFVFKHRLNKDYSACVYADVVVASDLASRIEGIADIRGHRCALPDRRSRIGATTLLYNHLHSTGEGPAFFGNTLDAETQLAALQMVAGKQTEVGILESPIINCQKNTLIDMDSFRVLASLGPLPPYRIMANKKLSDDLVRKLTSYLLNCNHDAELMGKLGSFGIVGFAENSEDFYELSDVKPVATRVPYY